ncbi:hypothetical protein SAMN04515647_3705 [Cohaesibacter sp. ES.047]|uniref:hypothetical protein n=1 Tax=Cohaesibacter sp. ES.047 TaxID=1798205 RepID=UPI000BB75CCF|nr:hypothetical protein [Cohaesibacter sp. ES.047]SNY93410.1 hypothetical protein SAMN04515647_3705 [Cohaesibacter sp. ES.047]
MSSVNFQVHARLEDLSQLADALNNAKKRIGGKAIARVTRKALKQGVDVVLDDTASDLADTGLSRSKVRRSIAVAYFNGGSMTSDAIMSSGWFRLADHGLGRKGGGGITNKLGYFRGTFKATMGSGHRGIFTRVGSARFPVRELWGLNPMREIERDNSEALEHGGDRAAQALEQFANDLLERAL